MSGPHIQEFHITPIAVTDPPLLNSVGLHQPYALRTIIQLITNDGITGISEIPGNVQINSILEQSREVVVGLDPFQLNHLKNQLDTRYATLDSDERGDNPWDQRTLVHVFSALEVACLDIQGKILGRPVVDLLGGRCRDVVSFDAYLFYKLKGGGGKWGHELDPEAVGWDATRQLEALSADQLVTQAQGMMDEFGFQSIKLKGGVFPPEKEVEAIHALHNAFGPGVPLRFDPNGVWSVETSIQYGKQMEGQLQYLEDPTLGQQGMSEVKAALDMPLATNMCTTSFDQIPSSIILDSEDIILSDHHFWGGLRASVHLGKVCEIFGRQLSMHSNSHLGISLMAMVHMAAAIPNLSYDLDTHYPWQSEEVIQGGRIAFEDGKVEVPTEPGLGIELDQASLNMLHQNYKKAGIQYRDDTSEMKKYFPEWQYEKIRW